jgi:hypothetical protein
MISRAKPRRRSSATTNTSRTSAQRSRTADVEYSSCPGNSTIPRPTGTSPVHATK